MGSRGGRAGLHEPKNENPKSKIGFVTILLVSIGHYASGFITNSATKNLFDL